MNSSRTRRKTQTAIVKATCPACGDVELTVDLVQVQTCLSIGSSTYSFQCPTCRLMVNKEATPAIVESLTGAGSRHVAWTLPAELSEPKVGPRITHDDLLEFHMALEGADWHSELADLSRRG